MLRVVPARTVLALVTATALAGWGLSAPAEADPSTPSPTPAASVDGTPRPSPSTPSASPSPAPVENSPAAGPADTTDAALTLAVAPTGGPVSDAFYEDLGSYAFSGTTTLPDGTVVTVQRRSADATLTDVASTTATGGTYAVSVPVEAAGAMTFVASAAGAEGAALTSGAVDVTVLDSTVALDLPATVDALKDAPATGRVVPARSGMSVTIEVQRGSAWRTAATVPTAADGTFAAGFAYGKGNLQGYTVRARFHAVNRDRDKTSATARVTRVAVLDPEVDDTTGADVAKTYRKGCPVGPSRLSTIHLNFYGRDKRMHRGVIIVRTDLRQEIIRGFDAALEHRYPIDKMNNPNTYGGNDPRQMKANNTSGFNCRKVVGNPYAMSPHSYGIAIDVNTVQNPYRDSHGKWWPSNGTSYRDRTPLRWGMLGKASWLTRSLRKDHFFWGGLWNPGRDYQHFEYRG